MSTAGNDIPEIQPFPVALIEACGLPEIGPLLGEMAVQIDGDLVGPFSLTDRIVRIRPDVAEDLVAAGTLLREAIENYTLSSLIDTWPRRILAHATAAIYAVTTLRISDVDDRDRPSITPPKLGDRLLAGTETPTDLAAEIAKFLAERDGLTPASNEDIAAAARAIPLAAPTEVILTQGGDHRQAVDWETGLNSYGISPRPVPWTAQYGSCTASAPSGRAFAAAQRLRHELVEAAVTGRLEEALAERSTSTRSTIPGIIGLDPDEQVDVILTPSGTDAEIVALAMVLGDRHRVRSIVVAPGEVGSGTLDAAAGNHFSPMAPLGDLVDVGRPIRGLSGKEVELKTVEVRDGSGGLRSPAQIEAEIDRLVEETEDLVLLHVVEGSKTGIRAPSDGAIADWERAHGERLRIVVDAAQMRVDQKTVANHFRNGRMVFLTGSKFFGGPPFSGALLIPPSIAEAATDGAELPVGLADYVSRHDLPERLTALHRVANPEPNVPLLLRWEAALTEIRSFHNASPEIRDQVLRDLVAGIRHIVDASPHVEIVESPYTVIPGIDHRGLDDLPTIFTFLVLDNTGAPLGVDAAKRLQRLVSTDLTEAMPGDKDGDSRRLARQTFQFGQPVPISRSGRAPGGGLRLAIGAPTLYQIIFDHTRGLTWRARVERELNDIQGAFDKVALVLERMQEALTG